MGSVASLNAQVDSTTTPAASATTPAIYDVVTIKGGSKLTGTIIKWDLERGMEFKLATGATVILPKSEIYHVSQDIMLNAEYLSSHPYVRQPRPYAFREHGLYETFSVFLNFSDPGGAGLTYSIGHRFTRMLGVGLGIGYETNDTWNSRNQIPLFAEARGFFLKEKISPYYGVKLGYSFALKNELWGTIDAKGGMYFSPELGVRFGSRAVNYYLGMEYKILSATYVDELGWDGTSTDKITYRRLELRTGLLF